MPRKPSEKKNTKQNKKDIIVEEKIGLKKKESIIDGGKIEEFEMDSDSDLEKDDTKMEEEPESVDDEVEDEDDLGDDVEIDEEEEEDGNDEDEDEDDDKDDKDDIDEECMYSDAEEDEDYEEENAEEVDETENDYEVPIENRKTKPYITNNERVNLISKRATMIANDAKPMLKNALHLTPEQIAIEEYYNKVIPMKIIRTLPDNSKEVWKITEFENIER